MNLKNIFNNKILIFLMIILSLVLSIWLYIQIEHFLMSLTLFFYLSIISLILIIYNIKFKYLIIYFSISTNIFLSLFNVGIYYNIMNYWNHKNNFNIIKYDTNYKIINKIKKTVPKEDEIFFDSNKRMQIINYYIFPRKLLYSKDHSFKYIKKLKKKNTKLNWYLKNNTNDKLDLELFKIND